MLNQEDNTKVQNFIRYFINQKHAVYDHEMNEQHLCLPQIDKYLANDMIICQKQSLSWQDAIVQAGNVLLNKQMIEQSYIDQVIENVQEYSFHIVLGDHVALAHANNKNNVFQSGMSLLVSKNSIFLRVNILSC